METNILSLPYYVLVEIMNNLSFREVNSFITSHPMLLQTCQGHMSEYWMQRYERETGSACIKNIHTVTEFRYERYRMLDCPCWFKKYRDNIHVLSIIRNDKVEKLKKIILHDAKEVNELFVFACLRGSINSVAFLLANSRVDPADNNNYAICYASRYGHVEVVELLLADYRVNPADRNNYAIQWASSDDHVEIVKVLLADYRVNPADRNNYAIQRASENGHVEVVKILLADPRVNPAVFNNKVIRCASRCGYLEIVKVLLADPRVDPADFNNEAIKLASDRGHVEIVKILLADLRVKKTIT